MCEYNIRQATLEDAEEIFALLRDNYFSETIYRDLTFSPENTRQSIIQWIHGNAAVVAEKNGIQALAAGEFFRSFYEEVELDIEIFYVHPDHRGTGLSRKLVDYCVKAAEQVGAKIVYSACLSGVSEVNDNLYANLWGKFGFKKLGTVMLLLVGK